MANKQPVAYIIEGDGWRGLYIDGKLHVEGHSISADDVLKSLGYRVAHLSADQEWLEKSGLPQSINDCMVCCGRIK